MADQIKPDSGAPDSEQPKPVIQIGNGRTEVIFNEVAFVRDVVGGSITSLNQDSEKPKAASETSEEWTLEKAKEAILAGLKEHIIPKLMSAGPGLQIRCGAVTVTAKDLQEYCEHYLRKIKVTPLLQKNSAIDIEPRSMLLSTPEVGLWKSIKN